jgi:AcrR family transcriptional regulator
MGRTLRSHDSRSSQAIRPGQGCVRPLPAHLSGLPVGIDRLSHEVIADHRRERFLRAATKVFATRGYRATTVEDLASASHVGVGSFYALFDGKQDCFLGVYDRVAEAGTEQIAAAIPTAAPWPERARAALAALLDWTAAEPHGARIALIEAQTAGPAALARYRETLKSLATLLREGRACGPAAAGLPESFEYATACGVAWLLCDRLATEATNAIEALLPDLLEIAVEPYLGRDAASSALDLPHAVPLPALVATPSS